MKKKKSEFISKKHHYFHLFLRLNTKIDFGLKFKKRTTSVSTNTFASYWMLLLGSALHIRPALFIWKSPAKLYLLLRNLARLFRHAFSWMNSLVFIHICIFRKIVLSKVSNLSFSLLLNLVELYLRKKTKLFKNMFYSLKYVLLPCRYFAASMQILSKNIHA